MKRLYVAILALLMPVVAGYAQEDVLSFWTTMTLNKSFGKENKWTAGVMHEYRHNIHEGVSQMSQFFVRPSVSYKLKPWMTLQYQMDFATTPSSGFQWRSIPEITLSKKVSNFTFAYRQRVMTTFKFSAGTNSTLLRSRARVEYKIPKSPVSTHFAIEPYWCEFGSAVKTGFNWLQKIRWYAGLNIKVTDGITFSPQYVCQAYHNHQGRYARRTYDDHVVYLTINVKM